MLIAAKAGRVREIVGNERVTFDGDLAADGPLRRSREKREADYLIRPRICQPD